MTEQTPVVKLDDTVNVLRQAQHDAESVARRCAHLAEDMQETVGHLGTLAIQARRVSVEVGELLRVLDPAQPVAGVTRLDDHR